MSNNKKNLFAKFRELNYRLSKLSKAQLFFLYYASLSEIKRRGLDV